MSVSSPGVVVHAKADEFLATLPVGSVGAIVTDPPFHISTGRAPNWGIKRGMGSDPWTSNEVTTVDECIDWTRPVMRQCSRVIRPGGALVVMGGTQSLLGWDWWAPRMGFIWMAELIVLWNTGKPRVKNFGGLHTRIAWYTRVGLRHTWNTEAVSMYSNIVVCQKVPVQERLHPSEKPVGLTNFIVSLLTNSTDLIVDPFAGSGSTLVSAIQCDRCHAGCDSDLRYVHAANRRLVTADEEQPEPIYLWINGNLREV